MVAVKPAQITAFLTKPPTVCHAVLVYGADAGLVTERATQLSHYFANLSNPMAEIVRVDDSDLEDTPDRLVIELKTISMFGEGKVVKTALGRRITGAMIKSILEAGSLECFLVVEAGNLKAGDAARKAFETISWAAALPCFADTQRDLSVLIDDVMRQSGHTLAGDAKQALLNRLGADRAQSRGEIQKLILFAGHRREITSEDVFAIVGDAAATALDTIVSHTANGRVLAATSELARSVGAGENPQTIIAAMQRHFRRLHRICGAIETGVSFDEATRTLRPPLFFKQKDDMRAQCSRWTIPRINTALTRIADILKLARQNASLEYEFTERLVLELATMAGDNRRR